MSVMMGLVLGALLLQASAIDALGKEGEHRPQSNLIARHQVCVLQAFAYNTISVRRADHTLLGRSVEQCEALLQPLKHSIIARTKDPKFADSILEKIRRASKRGAAIAIVGYLSERK